MTDRHHGVDAPQGRAAFLDPAGAVHGIPTYPWNWAWATDADLRTRTQLAAEGLRPGEAEPVAQLMWRSRRARKGRVRTAALYRRSAAVPKLPMTDARARSLAAALRARRTCPTCTQVFVYCMPTSLGQCPNCEYGHTPEAWELEDAA